MRLRISVDLSRNFFFTKMLNVSCNRSVFKNTVFFSFSTVHIYFLLDDT